MKAIVIFNVGEKNPLFGKEVAADINPYCGYSHMDIFGTTTTSDDIIFSGWVEKIYVPELDKFISAPDYCEYQTYLKLKNKFENYGK